MVIRNTVYDSWLDLLRYCKEGSTIGTPSSRTSHSRHLQRDWSSNATALRKREKFRSRKSATNATPRCWTFKSSVANSIRNKLNFWYLGCQNGAKWVFMVPTRWNYPKFDIFPYYLVTFCFRYVQIYPFCWASSCWNMFCSCHQDTVQWNTWKDPRPPYERPNNKPAARSAADQLGRFFRGEANGDLSSRPLPHPRPSNEKATWDNTISTFWVVFDFFESFRHMLQKCSKTKNPNHPTSFWPFNALCRNHITDIVPPLRPAKGDEAFGRVFGLQCIAILVDQALLEKSLGGLLFFVEISSTFWRRFVGSSFFKSFWICLNLFGSFVVCGCFGKVSTDRR